MDINNKKKKFCNVEGCTNWEGKCYYHDDKCHDRSKHPDLMALNPNRPTMIIDMDSGNNNHNNNITNPSPNKKRKRSNNGRPKCTFPGCTNNSVKSSVCIRHGATQPKCTHVLNPLTGEGRCTSQAKRGGLCQRHGADQVVIQKCQHFEGCDRKAHAGGSGLCIQHDGTKVNMNKRRTRKLCDFEGGCTSQSWRGGKCRLHGGVKRKRSSNTSDGDDANNNNNNYKRPTCRQEGCDKQAVRGGTCLRHGGTQAPRKICSVDECTNLSRKGGVCTKHGAVQKKLPSRYCQYEGCTKYKRSGGVLCIEHNKLKEAVAVGCNDNDKVGDGDAPPSSSQPTICGYERCMKLRRTGGMLCMEHNQLAEALFMNADKDGASSLLLKPPTLPPFNTTAEHHLPTNNVNVNDRAKRSLKNDDSSDHDNASLLLNASKNNKSDVAQDVSAMEEQLEQRQDKIASVDHDNGDGTNNNYNNKNASSSSKEYNEYYGHGFGNEGTMPITCQFITEAKEDREKDDDSFDGNSDSSRNDHDSEDGSGSEDGAGDDSSVDEEGIHYGNTMVAANEGDNGNNDIDSEVKNTEESVSVGDDKNNTSGSQVMSHKNGKEKEVGNLEYEEHPISIPQKREGSKARLTPKCTVKGCTNFAVKAHVCIRHGARAYIKICTHEGCTKFEQKGGVCWLHGAKQMTKLKTCSYEGGCTHLAQKGGVCYSHGAKWTKKPCPVEGCNTRTGGGLCFRHMPEEKKRMIVKICTAEGCTRHAVSNGVCRKHGAVIKVKICSTEGCTNQVVNRGVCQRHGAVVAKCKYESGCENQVQKRGLCARHGGKVQKTCKHEGCTRYPVQKGMCTLHGADKRPVRAPSKCGQEGCTRNVCKGGLCRNHGNFVPTKCSHEGCSNIVQQGGLCLRHGAKRNKNYTRPNCSHAGCSNIAYKDKLCKRHGVHRPKKCRHEGCNSISRKGGLCQMHGAVKCSHEGCTNQARQAGLCKRHYTETKKQSTSPKAAAKKDGQSVSISEEPVGPTEQSVGGSPLSVNEHLLVQRKCSHIDCTGVAWKRGLCERHADLECSAEGCTIRVRKGVLCWKHSRTMDVQRCSLEGCNVRVRKGELCWKHSRTMTIV